MWDLEKAKGRYPQNPIETENDHFCVRVFSQILQIIRKTGLARLPILTNSLSPQPLPVVMSERYMPTVPLCETEEIGPGFGIVAKNQLRCPEALTSPRRFGSNSLIPPFVGNLYHLVLKLSTVISICG